MKWGISKNLQKNKTFLKIPKKIFELFKIFDFF
jgi:hypothetical protein